MIMTADTIGAVPATPDRTLPRPTFWVDVTHLVTAALQGPAIAPSEGKHA